MSKEYKPTSESHMNDTFASSIVILFIFYIFYSKNGYNLMCNNILKSSFFKLSAWIEFVSKSKF